MKTKEVLQELLSFAERMRRSGTTTLVEHISNHNDVYVIAPLEVIARDFVGGVSYSELKDCTEKKPILLDNITLADICRVALREIERLEDRLEGQC